MPAMPHLSPCSFARLLRSIFIAAVTAAAALSGAHAGEARPWLVGMQGLQFEDAARRDWGGHGARPISALVWYPAADTAREADWEAGIYTAGRNARGAAMREGEGRLPLILLSHGTGGAAAGLAWLGEALAANGYIVAAPNHHGNTGAEPVPYLQGTLVWWDRPRDLSVLLDRLLAHPQWAGRIDASRIGVAGYSIGGYTALATVGARLSRAQWREFCLIPATAAACRLPPEVSARFPPQEAERLLTQDPRVLQALARMDDDYGDARIRAAFVMAPAAGPALRRDSLARISRPIHLVVGSDDDQAIPRFNAEPIARASTGAVLEILPRVSHYSFLPVCNERGRLAAPPLCTDPPGVDRAALHQAVSRRALEFFNRTLAVH